MTSFLEVPDAAQQRDPHASITNPLFSVFRYTPMAKVGEKTRDSGCRLAPT